MKVMVRGARGGLRGGLRAGRAALVGSGAAAAAGVGRRAGAGARCGAKKDIHPEFHQEAKVYCNGEEVFAVGGTDASYDVDIWSGNHPAFMEEGGASNVLDDELIVKFSEKFGDMGDFGCVPLRCGSPVPRRPLRARPPRSLIEH